MQCTVTHFPYRQTGYLSKIIIDYLDGAESLRPFYRHPVSLEGIRSAIEVRRGFDNRRAMLTEELRKQYQDMSPHVAVQSNIERLEDENCFTVTTAHQPAIFTGSLYFMYKILHSIRLAAYFAKEFPHYQFVPVFYMGSEDADLEELGNIYLNGEKITWNTNQTGAVGRMNTKGLDKILRRIEGEFSVLHFGKELLQLLKECYLQQPDIQSATFALVHALFAEYGLVVLIPDNANLKRTMIPVFEEDLFRQTGSRLVESTIRELEKKYKVQARPRPINLFYLRDNLRCRIEKKGQLFHVLDTRPLPSSPLTFDENEILTELHEHPERFSPNVILRGLFQGTILPDIAFLGGGGETAYWLELKDLFEHHQVPFPVLVLRNSFLLVRKKWREKTASIHLSVHDFFRSEEDLLNELVKRESGQRIDLGKEISDAEKYYGKLRETSQVIDPTLAQHVASLEKKAIRPLEELEKKLLRAEKRKYNEQRRHIHALKSALFPQGNLQERIENFIPYYAEWGRPFLEMLYQHSLALEQQFSILEET